MAGAGERWAIYFAPAAASALRRFGDRWLGRDVETGARLAQPSVPGIPAERLAELTEAPRYYGFHATLKPPFHLAGADPVALIAAAEAFTATRAPFRAAALRPARIGRFIALTFAAPAPDVMDLAADCVRAFDRFRAPPSEAELAKRRAAGLSERQERYLAEWGYPYVFDEFRFHLTLTGPFEDDALAARISAFVEAELADTLAEPLAVEGIALFRQPDRASPFVLERRLPFGA